MSEKKVVGRNIAIGLGILCIILLIGLAASEYYYTPIINDRERTISQLEGTNSNLQDQIRNLTAIAFLQSYIDLVFNQAISQPANANTSWTFTIYYAGWMEIAVSSTTNTTYARVIYEHGLTVLYDNSVNLNSTIGYVSFPVLPTSVTVQVGNTNLTEGANDTVTIRYYY
jgi:hypothetical protein